MRQEAIAVTDPEILRRLPYAERIRIEAGRSRIWDYLRYDENGDLWVNDLRIKDVIDRIGTPLEIVDTTIVETRCRQWQELVREVAGAVGYPGEFEFYYAAKANMSGEITHAAYRSGWGAETSSPQDLLNLVLLAQHGLIGKSTRIVCNGFKLPPQAYGFPPDVRPPYRSGVVFEYDNHAVLAKDEISYASLIVLMRDLGYEIIPVLDQGELDYFAQGDEVPAMEVGLRLKFGKVISDDELARLVSRHGMSWSELRETAARIDRTKHLKLTMLHTMVGAAETIPVDNFVKSLLYAADKYFQLKAEHPTLSSLNIGGGVPPLSEDYDHSEFLRKLLTGLKEKASVCGLPLPKVCFELGSLVATESGLHVFKVVQRKETNFGPDGKPERWAIVDGGLMAAIPDMLLIGSEFVVLAADNANSPAAGVRLGDLSCDSDGRYPPKVKDDRRVLLPDTQEEQHLVIVGVGAYQEILAGIRGAHHCGLLEAAELILERRADGRVHGRLIPRQTRQDLTQLLGYDAESLKALKLTKLFS